MTTQPATLPTDTQRRIDLLDISRGFAVFGIFVVNIEIMNCTIPNQGEFSGQWISTIDQLSVRILQLFFYTKFFPIFSFLFGLGIAMQALKSMDKKDNSSSFFIRRMLGLFIIGVLHILLIWSGDVLHLYAILGLTSIWLLRIYNKLIIGGAIVLLLFPFYEQLLAAIFEYLSFSPESYLEGYSSEEITRVLRTGSYLEGMQFRMLEWIANIPILFVFLAPLAFSMFLFGLYFGKKGFVYSIDRFVDKTKKTAIAVAILTNAYRLLFLFVLLGSDIFKAHAPVFLKLMVLGDVALGLVYLWLIAWLVRFPKWNKIFSPLKYAGRMALTNYIMHSFIGLFLFSSIGFQLYETLSPAATLLVATAVFCFQVIFSKIWMSHFYFGPLEWIWRCFSYQKIFPIKRRPVPEPAL